MLILKAWVTTPSLPGVLRQVLCSPSYPWTHCVVKDDLDSWPFCFYFPNARITQICHHTQLKFYFYIQYLFIYLREVLCHGILVEIRGQLGGSWFSPPSLRILVIELRSAQNLFLNGTPPPKKKSQKMSSLFKHGNLCYKILSDNLSYTHTHTLEILWKPSGDAGQLVECLPDISEDHALNRASILKTT